MFTEKNILYIDTYNTDKCDPKPKYFVVIKQLEDEIIISSLTTSQDHIPDAHKIENTGCISHPDECLSCFFFKANEIISSDEAHFSFPKDTYIYGETLCLSNTTKLTDDYINNNNLDSIISTKGAIKDDIYNRMIDCFKNSPSVKRKIKKSL